MPHSEFDKESIDSIAVILKIYLLFKRIVRRIIFFLITPNKLFLLFVYQRVTVKQKSSTKIKKYLKISLVSKKRLFSI